MPFDFRRLPALEAQNLIAASSDPLLALESRAEGRVDSLLAATVRRFLAGDHWQEGDGWVGPKPSNVTDGASDASALKLIEERFVSRNMIFELVDRHTTGAVGREPRFAFTLQRSLKEGEKPTAAEQKMIDAAEAAMTEWYNKRECHRMFQFAATEALMSGRAMIRLFVPAQRLVPISRADAGQAEGEGEPQGPQLMPDGAVAGDAGQSDGSEPTMVLEADTLADALDLIYVEVVTAEDGGIFTDADSMERCGIVRYRRQGDLPNALGPEVVEFTFLDGDSSTPPAERDTLVRVASMTENDDSQIASLSLGGRLTQYAVTRPPLINAQVVQLQKALNLALSMLPRNLETSGFLERIIMNAQLPGEWEVGPDGEPTGRFIPGTYRTGAGVTTFLQGLESTDTQGNTVVANPSVQHREPSPVTPTVDGANALTAEILREGKQAHVLGTDQVQSGVSRVQARADFEKSLGRSVAALNPAGRWLIETTLAWALLIASDAGDATGASDALRVDFECIVDTGPLERQEVADAVTAAKEGIVSYEYAMEAIGVEDTDAEKARMDAELGHRNALRTAKAAALKGFVDTGISLETSAKLAGFEDEEVALIAKDVAANPVPSPVPGTMQPAKNPDGSPKLDANGDPVMEPVPAGPGGAGAQGGGNGGGKDGAQSAPPGGPPAPKPKAPAAAAA